MNNLVSVIIPAFNCERHIKQCLNSLIHQDYKNLQIIVINDGSTDHTLEKASIVKDDRIQIITTKNVGVSSARNKGLSLAKGRYVMFADADDCFLPHAIRSFMDANINFNYDFIISEYSRKLCNHDLNISYSSPKCISISSNEACKKIINPYGFYGSVWAKLFDSKVISKYHLKFNNKISVGEDLLFTFNYLKYANKIGYLAVKTYYYYDNKSSVLNTLTFNTINKRMDILKVYEAILKDPYISNQNCYSRAISIYTRELCDWYSVIRYFNGNEELAKKLKGKAQANIKPFLRDHTFSKKTKLAALIKLTFPKLAWKMEKKI